MEDQRGIIEANEATVQLNEACDKLENINSPFPGRSVDIRYTFTFNGRDFRARCECLQDESGNLSILNLGGIGNPMAEAHFKNLIGDPRTLAPIIEAIKTKIERKQQNKK